MPKDDQEGRKVKPKFTVSIDPDIVEWIDGEIAKKNFSSRSHALEKAAYELMRQSGEGKE